MANKRVLAQPTRVMGDLDVRQAGSVAFSISLAEDNAFRLVYAGTYLGFQAVSGTLEEVVTIDFSTGLLTAASGLSVTGPLTLPAGSVELADIVDGTGFSVLGRATGSAGVMAGIAASAAHTVLRYTGSVLGFGTLNVAGLATTGTASDSKMLRGDGVWSNTIDGLFTANGKITAGNGFEVTTGTVTLPNVSIDFDALKAEVPLEVLKAMGLATTATASEALAAGDMVHLDVEGGTVTKADTGDGLPANGFVKSAYSSSATATVYMAGLVEANTADTVALGDNLYLQNTAGEVTTNSGAKGMTQHVGIACGTDTSSKVWMRFSPGEWIGT